MSKDTWRDREGFGRPSYVDLGTWEQYGPDDESHAIRCEFIENQGILPCSCDATRKRFGRDEHGERTYWFEHWLRWQQVRVSPWNTRQRTPWPVTGPDGEPWVPGVDFSDDAEDTK